MVQTEWKEKKTQTTYRPVSLDIAYKMNKWLHDIQIIHSNLGLIY